METALKHISLERLLTVRIIGIWTNGGDIWGDIFRESNLVETLELTCPAFHRFVMALTPSDGPDKGSLRVLMPKLVSLRAVRVALHNEAAEILLDCLSKRIHLKHRINNVTLQFCHSMEEDTLLQLRKFVFELDYDGINRDLDSTSEPDYKYSYRSSEEGSCCI